MRISSSSSSQRSKSPGRGTIKRLPTSSTCMEDSAMAAVADGFEAGGEAVVKQKPADKRFADAGDELDDLHCLQRAEHAGQRPHDAGFGAAWYHPFRRRRGEKVAPGWVRTPVFVLRI